MINGLIVTYMRVTPFIATLATWSIWSGVALILPKEGRHHSANLEDGCAEGREIRGDTEIGADPVACSSFSDVAELKRTRFVTRI